MKALAAALVEFQKNAPEIKRSKEVEVHGFTKDGKPFKYTFSYAPDDVIREAIKQLMGECGLACLHMLSSQDGKPSLRTVLVHESGEQIESEFPLPLTGSETAQGIGSMLTYIKRYSLVSSLGLTTEDDDDGNIASGNTSTAREGGGRKDAAAGTAASTTASVEDGLTVAILAAADKLGAKEATEKAIAKSKAERTPDEHVAWLGRNLKTAERNVKTLEETTEAAGV